MKVEMLPIGELKMAPYNPRKMPKVEMDNLKRSITRFGFVEPIVMNTKTGNVVGGHQRLQAATELGIKEVPVVKVSLTDKEEKKLNIALNRISGEWDMDKLEEIMRELEPEDRIDTGFSEAEISKILGQFEADEEELTSEGKARDPQMILTFHSVEDLHKARPQIEELMQQYGGRYSLSSGEF